jgi:hypothetical protein
MLWQLKRTSPFRDLRSQELPTDPMGLSPLEYLEIYADTAAPHEWTVLATAFLAEINKRR